MVLISLQAWAMLGDLGISNALQNKIAKQRASEQGYDDYIIYSIIILGLIVLILLIILYIFGADLLVDILPGEYIGKSSRIKLIISTLGTIYLLNTFGLIGYKILYAEHKGYYANIISAVGSIMGLLGIYTLSLTNIGNKILWASILWVGPAALLSMTTTIMILVSRVNEVNLGKLVEVANEIKSLCINFFLLAIFSAITLQLDYLIIAKVMKDQDIITYSITTKILFTLVFFYTAISQVIYPKSAEAASNKNWKKVNLFLIEMIFSGFIIIIIGSIIGWVFKSEILTVLASSKIINITISLWVLLTIYLLIRVWTDSYSAVIQGIGDIKIFLYFIPIQAIISVSMQLILVKKYGLNGVVVGIIISFIATAAWILPMRLSWIKNKL